VAVQLQALLQSD